MPIRRFRVELLVRGPVLSRSTSIGAFGVDSPAARDQQGRVMLTGDLVEGKLLAAWLDLLDCGASAPQRSDIERWLGRHEEQPVADGPKGADPLPPDLGRRKRLHLGDFVATSPELRPATRSRIAIDAETGTARKHFLQSIEVPFPAGSKVRFVGEARALVPEDEQAADAAAQDLREKLRAGLRWMSQVGAHGTVGFGIVEGAEVDEVPVSRVADPGPRVDGPRVALQLRLSEPLCIALRRTSANIFESAEIIPGGVLKGTIARIWAAALHREPTLIDSGFDPRRPALSKVFGALRFGHLFPAPLPPSDGGRPRLRPVPPPLSIVKTRTGRYFDVACLEKPALFGGEAPAFSPDWKSAPAWRAGRFGWTSLERELRVRTAIGREERRALDEQLFAYEMVIPDRHEWLGWLDLPDSLTGAERRQVLSELHDVIATGLVGIGKTKAAGSLALLPADAVQPFAPSCAAPRSSAEATWIVTLLTPALLLDPEEVEGRSDRESLRTAYANSFRALSGDSVELVRYFARQSMAGGRFLFMDKLRHLKSYRPFLLTEPGSVFVFKRGSSHDSAEPWLEGLLRLGLEVPWRVRSAYQMAAEDGESEAWLRCPYRPENGYGEVAVNLEIHDDWAPRSGDSEPFDEVFP